MSEELPPHLPSASEDRTDVRVAIWATVALVVVCVGGGIVGFVAMVGGRGGFAVAPAAPGTVPRMPTAMPEKDLISAEMSAPVRVWLDAFHAGKVADGLLVAPKLAGRRAEFEELAARAARDLGQPTGRKDLMGVGGKPSGGVTLIYDVHYAKGVGEATVEVAQDDATARWTVVDFQYASPMLGPAPAAPR